MRESEVTIMKMQFRDMFYMDCHPSSRSHPGPMSSLRSQFMETEAFQDLMDQSLYDCSTDGGSDSGENSLGGSERKGLYRRADSTSEDSLHDQDLPDSASHGVYERKLKKKNQIHQV